MPSTYGSFEVKTIDRTTGQVTFFPGATVQVRDYTDPDNVVRLLPDLVAGGGGVVASGSLDVDEGSDVRFSWLDDETGVCGFAEEVTT